MIDDRDTELKVCKRCGADIRSGQLCKGCCRQVLFETNPPIPRRPRWRGYGAEQAYDKDPDANGRADP